MGLLYDVIAALPKNKNEDTDMILSKDDAMRLSEAITKAGISMSEAIQAFMEAAGYIIKAASAIVQPTNEALREVATGKEYYLMKSAKKHRTRKKYRNRLTKRYFKEL